LDARTINKGVAKLGKNLRKALQNPQQKNTTKWLFKEL
jgi:hypothetical protein